MENGSQVTMDDNMAGVVARSMDMPTKTTRFDDVTTAKVAGIKRALEL